MRFPGVFRIVLFILVCVSLVSAAGEPDTTFKGSIMKVGTERVHRTIVQPDGKVIISGEFSAVSGAGRKNLARINADGSLDTTFNPSPVLSRFAPSAGPPIFALGIQSDGKILVGGQFTNGLKRLNPDGSDDTAFNSSPWHAPEYIVYHIRVLADDKILYSGVRSGYHLTILNPDGSLNTSTNARASMFTLQTDGKIVASDDLTGILQRYNADLTPDASFAHVNTGNLNGQSVYSIVTQPDGKIVIGGGFLQVNGTALIYVARINTNGTVDPTFNVGVGFPNAPVNSVTYLPGGNILIGGLFDKVNGVTANHVAVLNTDGQMITVLNIPLGLLAVYEIDVQTDGKYIISGRVSSGTVKSPVLRINSTGSIDASFNAPVGAPGTPTKVFVLPDDKILVSGDFTHASGFPRTSLVRFNSDGTLDTTFNLAGVTGTIQDFSVFPDGKIVVARPSFNIVRLNSNGSFDSGFVGTGSADAVHALPDGKMMLSLTNGVLRRLSANGAIDSTFTASTGGSGRIYKIESTPDGKVLVGGNFGQINLTSRPSLARLNANGAIDTAFNLPGGANDVINDIDLQTDGKVIISGVFTSVSFTFRTGLARLNADGSLDTDFAPQLNNSVEAARVQPDGKILIGGLFTSVNGSSALGYSRLNANGSRDLGFTTGSGTDSPVYDIDLQSDNKIVLVGTFTYINGSSSTGMARLLNAPVVIRAQFDYDGDGRSDVSVFRPSENKWYVLRSSDAVITQQTFAVPGDIAAPADYDGDGKTDLAIFRPSSGDWWSLSSATGAQVFAHWGGTGDIPRPSDFDGDGRADYVLFRPSDNNWYRQANSTGASSNGAFGSPGDKPLVGDFDGDGKSDKAIYRPSMGDWWWESSINSVQRVVHWGDATDIPVPGDYDADGKTDMAVYRPSIGTWYILGSSNGSFVGLNFGLAEDKPVAADYDGDGRADISVFRPSTGLWYLNRSTAGFTATQFGISGDVPTENAFVP